MSITRPAFALSTAALSTAALSSVRLLCPPHVARAQGAARHFRLGHNNSAGSATHTAALAMAAALDKSSNRRFLIDVSPNAALGTEVQMLKAVANGTLDLNVCPVGTAATLAKEVGLMETPYQFKDVDHARHSIDGPLGKHCEALLRPTGVAVLASSEIGLRHITAKRPIQTFKDGPARPPPPRPRLRSDAGQLQAERRQPGTTRLPRTD